VAPAQSGGQRGTSEQPTAAAALAPAETSVGSADAGDHAAAIPAHTPEAAASIHPETPAEPKPQGSQSVDLASLDPVTRERFRVLRRVAPPNKSDAELLEQIRKAAARGGAQSPASTGRRLWPWRR
jgi:BMFP domain-containing protein YqiC